MRRLSLRSIKQLPLLVVLLLAIGAVSQYQTIHDWWRLRNYVAPDAVAALADETTLTSKARRLFYVNHPALQDRSSFSSSCSSRGEQTIVLGCYHPVDRGIYVFRVTDERLNGVNQVTAAHEMLHAAYDRLSTRDRKTVDAELQALFDSGRLDARVTAIIEAYKISEPNDVVNEMHSVFGTEVKTLPADLETYYRQYFTNRAAVVAYANTYQAEFTSRQNQVTAADDRLKTMKQQISDDSAALDKQEAQITNLRTALDANRSSGNIDAYNNGVPIYNARIETYNNLIATTKTLIKEYNDLVASRNQLALQVSDLARSIDSSLQTISDTNVNKE